MNIAVVFGGESCEHDISVITGVQLVSKMNEYLYNVYPIFIDKNGKWNTGDELKDVDNFTSGLKKLKECVFVPNDKFLYIKRGKYFKQLAEIDMVFICLHGERGEDGSVSSIFKLNKIPYSSSDICASSVCLNKGVFKTYAKGLGVNIVDGFSVGENEFITNFDIVKSNVENMGYPVIIKPSCQGSSIGIEVCYSEDNLNNSLKNALKYGKSVLIEKFIKFDKEVNIALFDNKGEIVYSFTEEPITSDEILSFDNKYRKNSGGFETIKRVIPAGITQEKLETIKEYAQMVYRGLDMFGVVRFDFLVAGDVVYLNEVNTIPGSMANYLFDKQTMSYPVLIDKIISNAVFRQARESEVLKVFDSGVTVSGIDGLKK